MADETKNEGETEGASEKEMGLKEINAALKKLMPEVQKLMEHMSTMGAGKGDDDSSSEEVYGGASDGDTERKDGDETRDSKDESEKKDGEGKDSEKADGEKSEGKAVDTKEGKGMDVKDVLREVAQRDKLASGLSHFVGTFDHSEMTLDEVASYGVKKLGIPSVKGQERTALQAFLHDRPAPTKAKAYGMDSKTAAQGDSEVDQYIKN